MEITVTMKFIPGFGERPRPALRITARALRRTAKGHLEEFVHTRVVDATYPESWAAGLDQALTKMQELRDTRARRLMMSDTVDLEDVTHRMVG